MRPLYDASIAVVSSSVWPHGHSTCTKSPVLATAGVASDRKVLNLAGRMRCRECDEMGRAVVSIRWQQP